MELTYLQTAAIIAAVALGAASTRFLPFLLFPEHKTPPKVVSYLGQVLPPAMMGLLVVYCLKGISIWENPHGIPEFLGILAIVILHGWKRNVLLSIGGGTAVYMLLIQNIF